MGVLKHIDVNNMTLATAAIAMLFLMIGFSFPNWLTAENGGACHFGLYRTCDCETLLIDGQTVPRIDCDEYKDVDSDDRAERVFATATLILGLLALGTMGLTVYSEHTEYRYLALGTVATSALCGLITTSAFANQQTDLLDNGFEYDWAFGVWLTGWLLMLGATAGFGIALQRLAQRM